MTVVSDTGPLIALAKVDRLSLLEDLFGQIHIPPIVHRELLAKSGPEAARLDDAFTHVIQVAQAPRLPSRGIRTVCLPFALPFCSPNI